MTIFKTNKTWNIPVNRPTSFHRPIVYEDLKIKEGDTNSSQFVNSLHTDLFFMDGRCWFRDVTGRKGYFTIFLARNSQYLIDTHTFINSM